MLNASTVIETVERFKRLSSDMLTVRPERCVCVRNRHASCTRCSDACTSGALSVEDGALRIEQEKCVGCGTCATVCPTCALEIQHPNDASLHNAARAAATLADGAAVFCCHRVQEEAGARFDETRVTPVVCLSRLEETLLVGLLAEGVERIVAVKGDCAHCPRHDGVKSIHLVKQTMDELMRVWNIDRAVDIVEELPAELLGAAYEDVADAAMVERSDAPAGADSAAAAQGAAMVIARSDATAGADGAAVAQGDAAAVARSDVTAVAQGDTTASDFTLPRVTSDGTLPHFVPMRRNKLLNHLATFGNPVTDTLDCRLWGHITIDMSVCRSCRMCAVFCPTGALSRFEDEDGTIGIEHYVAECVHCCLCQDICPAQAITSSTRVPTLQLANGEVERYPMPEPDWKAGSDQIVRKMQGKIGGDSVASSY